jgi:uncharacterized SAM-binding protein YcdF (DUF218 family)
MDFSFMLKKTISASMMPLSIALLILVVGLIFLDNNNIRKAKIFITTSFITLFIIAYQPFSNMLIKPLETSYPKLQKIPEGVSHILLLGGDVNNRGWEVLRLYNQIEYATIITSGYEGNKKIPEAIKTAHILQEIGIPSEDIIVHSKPKDTKEEAIKIKELLGDKPFILVTSAYHMPRAMALFQEEGLNPIPAPANIKERNNRYTSIPQAKNIQNTEIALHEYIGLLWALIKGQI